MGRRTGSSRIGLVLSSIMIGLGWAESARACATCDAGDTTLTVAGAELPFAGRLRSALEFRRRTDSIGRPGLDETRISEVRAELSTVWAPLERLMLMAQLPFMYREVQDSSLARSEAWGLGDVELRAKWFAFKDREFAPRLLIALLGGVRLPTAPWQRDALGERLPLEAQPGAGSLDLVAGPSLAWFAGDVSAYLSAQWSEPLVTRAPLDPGSALKSSLALQYQLVPWGAVRAATDGRWARPTYENGERDPNSGGSLWLAGADALLSLGDASSVVLGFRVPVANRLAGAHDEGAILNLALLYDW